MKGRITMKKRTTTPCYGCDVTNPGTKLVDITPESEYCIGVDSDRTVFDSMEIKHKNYFFEVIILYKN